MSYWFLPQVISDEMRAIGLQSSELALDAEGLADIARAHGADQIGAWLRTLHPQATPEHIATLAQHFWRLGHELLPEDHVIVRVAGGSRYMIGEVTGGYRREERGGTPSHLWPVRWLATDVAADSLPRLAAYAGLPEITEITDDRALDSLKRYIPALRKGNAGFFKWLGIIILIFELMYFWPRG